MKLWRVREDRLPLLVIAAMWAFTTVLWLTPGITKPDGAGYYVYLPSTYLDHDLLFFDEWANLGLIRNGVILHKEVTASGHLGDHWTIGSALIWYPAFVAGDILRVMIPPLARFPRNGLSLPYNVPVILTSALTGLLTLLIGFALIRRTYGRFAAVCAAAGIWLGTPLLWYSLRNPIMSHATSALACAVVVMLAVRNRRALNGRALFACGIAAGVAFAVRPQDGTFLLVPLFFMAGDGLGRLAIRLTALGCGFFLGALPELIVSEFLYGTPIGFITGGGAAKPFAAFERIWWWEPIFSWYHGLLPWSPFIAVALAGFYFIWRDDRPMALAGLYSFLAQWAVNATLERSFWGAYSFGQRRFLDCTIFFILGAAALLSRLPRILSVIITILTSLWSLSIFFAASSRLDLSAYYTPRELWQEQARALASASQYFRVFDSVPRAMTGLVFVLCAATIAVWVTLATASSSRPVRRWATELTAGVLTVVSCFLAFCGWNGQNRVDSYRRLIQFNRMVSSATGGADQRAALLSDELRYLQKSGRTDEAEATAIELRNVLVRRDEGIRRLTQGKVAP
ncbi:MAG: hypothetical protein ABI718_17875 [Acidobacteriota bacterium]